MKRNSAAVDKKMIECSGTATEKKNFKAKPRYNRINLILVKQVYSKPKILNKVRA